MTNFKKLKTDIQKMERASEFKNYLYNTLGIDCEGCCDIDCIDCIIDKLESEGE